MTALGHRVAVPRARVHAELAPADPRSVLDQLPALVAYWDTNLLNRLANEAYVGYFGKTPEEIFGRHISELLGPELYEFNRPYLERALAGERQEFDREVPSLSGVRYTQALYLPDVRDDGQVHGIVVLVNDLSARHTSETELAYAEARFRALFEGAPSATLMKDRDGVIVAANASAARLFGYPVSELTGMDSAVLLDPADVSAAEEVREKLFARQLERFSEERCYRHADGHPVWVQVEATLIESAGRRDDSTHILVQLQDISVRKTYERELEHLATHDALTGVLNRRGIAAELERQARRAQTSHVKGALLICDLDRFKQVNDSLGHDVGDELLIHVAHIIERSIRTTDAVGRLGGDEFAVVLSTQNLAQARIVAAKIQQSLAASNTVHAWGDLGVGVSIGAAEFSATGSVAETLREADRSMFLVKATPPSERRGQV